MELFKTLKNESGESLNIYYDSDPINPIEYDDGNIGSFFCFHRRYSLGHKHSLSVDEVKQIEKSNDYISLPLFLYDHSGITLSTSPFSCGWDSGKVGIIAVEKSKVREMFNKKIISKKLKEKVIGWLNAEVKTYNQYLTGEVFGFIIVDKEGNEGDSCWGFYGDNFKENGLLDSACWDF